MKRSRDLYGACICVSYRYFQTPTWKVKFSVSQTFVPTWQVFRRNDKRTKGFFDSLFHSFYSIMARRAWRKRQLEEERSVQKFIRQKSGQEFKEEKWPGVRGRRVVRRQSNTLYASQILAFPPFMPSEMPAEGMVLLRFRMGVPLLASLSPLPDDLQMVSSTYI